MTKVIYDQILMDTGNQIKDKFEDIKNDFQEAVEIEGFFNKVTNTPKFILGIVSKSLSNLLDIILVYFVSILVLFLFLPGIFYYTMYILTKRWIIRFEKR